MKQHADQLERWESWPLWALGLSNGLNIALWFILSMAQIEELSIPVYQPLVNVLPLIVVAGGIAAAVSLDGVLIATIAGTRHGRRGVWSWLTIVGACGFSAAIAYAVHDGSLDEQPALHVAQAVVLALYNLHLSQGRAQAAPFTPVEQVAAEMQPIVQAVQVNVQPQLVDAQETKAETIRRLAGQQVEHGATLATIDTAAIAQATGYELPYVQQVVSRWRSKQS